MEKPTLEFFATLGQYVYQYIDSEGKPYYTGKGNGDRCYAHVADKGFNPDECFIVARNLEKFEDKKDWQSFLLESYLIATQSPDGNSVAGHYKECFVMANLSEIFGEYQAEQHDMFESLPTWTPKLSKAHSVNGGQASKGLDSLRLREEFAIRLRKEKKAELL